MESFKLKKTNDLSQSVIHLLTGDNHDSPIFTKEVESLEQLSVKEDLDSSYMIVDKL
jgi:hypothetical protein